jgi:hypothetical protein
MGAGLEKDETFMNLRFIRKIKKYHGGYTKYLCKEPN